MYVIWRTSDLLSTYYRFSFQTFFRPACCRIKSLFYLSSYKILSVQLGFHGAFLKRELVDKNGPTACVLAKFRVCDSLPGTSLLIVLMQVDCLDSVRSDRLILISTEDPHFTRQTCAIFTIRVKCIVTRGTLMPRSISEDLYARWDIDKYYKHDGALLSVNCFRKVLLITFEYALLHGEGLINAADLLRTFPS